MPPWSLPSVHFGVRGNFVGLWLNCALQVIIDCAEVQGIRSWDVMDDVAAKIVWQPRIDSPVCESIVQKPIARIRSFISYLLHPVGHYFYGQLMEAFLLSQRLCRMMNGGIMSPSLKSLPTALCCVDVWILTLSENILTFHYPQIWHRNTLKLSHWIF